MDNGDGGHADWDDIKTFVAAAQTGSFGAAARRLKTTQPTVTRRIEDLELRLGAKLFDRGLRGVSLTRAGEMVYDRALTMQRASLDIERLSLDHETPDAGEVTVAMPEGIGGYVTGLEVADFVRENPSIKLGLDCGFYPENPVDSQVDLSIQLMDASGVPELTASPLATLHYALFASREYLDTYGAPTRIEAAVGHRFIYHSAQVSKRGRWGAKTSAFMELAEPAMVVNSSTVMLHAIQRGAGIGAHSDRDRGGGAGPGDAGHPSAGQFHGLALPSPRGGQDRARSAGRRMAGLDLRRPRTPLVPPRVHPSA